MTITREQLKHHLAVAKQHGNEWLAKIFTLALERLDMEPRPLSKIKEDAAIIVDEHSRGILVHRSSHGWAAWSETYSFSSEHLAIPLSSLPKVTT